MNSIQIPAKANPRTVHPAADIARTIRKARTALPFGRRMNELFAAIERGHGCSITAINLRTIRMIDVAADEIELIGDIAEAIDRIMIADITIEIPHGTDIARLERDINTICRDGGIRWSNDPAIDRE